METTLSLFGEELLLQDVIDDVFISDVDFTYVTDIAQLPEMFSVLGKSHVLAYDLEFSNLKPWEARPLLWQLSDGHTIYVGHSGKVPLKYLAPLLTLRTVIAHNGVTEYKNSLVNGLELTSVVDPMLGYQLCKAGLLEGAAKRSSGLAAVLWQYLKIEMAKEVRNEFIEHPGIVFTPQQLAYAAKDVRDLHLVWEKIWEELTAKALQVSKELEFTLIPTFGRMELTGMRVNKAAWTEYMEVLKVEQQELIERCLPALILGLNRYEHKQKQDLVGKRSKTFVASSGPVVFGETPTLLKIRKEITQGVQGRLLSVDVSFRDQQTKEKILRSRIQLLQAFAGYGIDLEKTDKGALQDELERLEAEITEEETLEAALPDPLKGLLQDMLELSTVSKLLTTYGEKMLKQISDDGEVRTSFFQLGAATQRVSSGKPINFTNIPVRGARGKKFRSFFVAAPGRKLVIADYSSLEQRIAAHLSQDVTMLKIFRENMDMHGVSAAGIFHVDYLEMEIAGQYDRTTGEWGRKDAIYDQHNTHWVRKDKDGWVNGLTNEILVPQPTIEELKWNNDLLSIKYMRDECAKTCSFASNYGGNALTLKKTLKNKLMTELEEIFNGYRGTYIYLFRWMDTQGHFAITQGYTINIAGGKRFYRAGKWESAKYFPTQQQKERARKAKVGKKVDGKIYTEKDCFRDSKRAVEAIRRQGFNTPVQSTAAIIVKRAMLRIDQDLARRGWQKVWGPQGRVLGTDGPGACIINQVHDELILDTDESIAEEVRDLVEKHMLEVELELLPTVPAGCSCHIGTSWSDK